MMNEELIKEVNKFLAEVEEQYRQRILGPLGTVPDTDKPLPHWAIGEANGVLQVGAQLCTRDGRKTGNAVIVSVEEFQWKGYKDVLFEVLTDAGNTLKLNTAEVFDMFYPPKYLMDVATAPGNRPTLEAQPCAYRHWSTEWHWWEVYSAEEVPANAPKDRQPLYATREG